MDAFIAAKAEIHLLPERLKALSDELFKTHPEEMLQVLVRNLTRSASNLRQITEKAFKPGDHLA